MTLFEAKQKVRANKNLDIVRRQVFRTEYFGVIPKNADINIDSNIIWETFFDEQKNCFIN